MFDKVQNNVKTTLTTATDAAHKTFQAGLGAVMLTQDELRNMFNKANAEVELDIEAELEAMDVELSEVVEEGVKLTDKFVERGAGVERLGREKIDTFVEGRRKELNSWANKAQEIAQSGAKSALAFLNIPTAKDIDSLGRKINALGRKVDKLRKAQEQALTAE